MVGNLALCFFYLFCLYRLENLLVVLRLDCVIDEAFFEPLAHGDAPLPSSDQVNHIHAGAKTGDDPAAL